MTWALLEMLSVVGALGILMVAAYRDIKERRIPNQLCLGICGLFALYSLGNLLDGAPFWTAVIAPLLTALLVLLVLGVLFALQMMGGGDVKLLASMTLFAGPDLALAFLLYATIAGGFVALATAAISKLKYAGVHEKAVMTVPYGVAIAAAGVWVSAVLLMKVAADL